jgi:hypothetical protein
MVGDQDSTGRIRELVKTESAKELVSELLNLSLSGVLVSGFMKGISG